MAAQTPIVKEATLNGVDVKIHACPWPLYRKLYSTDKPETAETLAVIEEVVRECVEPVGKEVDIVAISSRAQISRLFELAVSDEEGPKPDF